MGSYAFFWCVACQPENLIEQIEYEPTATIQTVTSVGHADRGDDKSYKVLN